MGRWIVLIRVIGMLVFMSMVRAQDPRGIPGVDYPNFFTIPETSFKCSEQKYNPGFYADLETKCQAFHFCYQDRQESFLCPTGTIFNQAVLTCDVWYKSNCSLSHMFYSVNAGPVMERAGKNLPMLLRLRNRSQSKPSVQKPTSSVYEKVSNLHETEAPSKTPSSPEDGMLNAENGETSIANSKDFEGKNEQISDSSEDGDASEEMGKDEFANEVEYEMGENVVYDTVNDEYYRDFDQYENDWQDGEPVNDEFSSFYEYREPGNVYGADEKESGLKYYINENESSENSDVDDSDYLEFAKRNSQTGHLRIRRKPIYVLNDQPEIERGTSNLESDALSESRSREGKEMNLTSEAPVQSTRKPEPFPRPTAIPHHLLNIPSVTPMSSRDFELAIIHELAYPGGVVPEGTPEKILYPLPTDNQTTSSEQTSSQSPDNQSDDETIYIVDDSDYPEFAKRNSQTGHFRIRRKPIYVFNDQPEIERGSSNPESDALSESQSREGKEMNLTSEASVEESTPKPEPFPRPTAIPHHLLNIPSVTPMSSRDFELAIINELAYPGGVVPEGTPEKILYPLPTDNQTTSEQTSSQSPDTQSDDETIYIENDTEPENYVPYDSRYEDVVIPESGEEAYVESYSESPDRVEADLTDTDDTFVVIPDEYDNVVDSESNEDFEIQSYPQETMYRTQMVADRSPVAVYDTYDNSYRYSPSIGYPQHYVQANYRDPFADAYQSFVPLDQRYSYERDYELSDQPINYENSYYDEENAYTQTELYPFSKTTLNVAEKPLELPVSETEVESLETEDFGEVAYPELIEGPEGIIGQPEDVYYVLDVDEQSTGNETKVSEGEKSIKLESSLGEPPANEHGYDTEQTNSSSDESISANVPLDSDSEGLEYSQMDEGSNWSSNSQNGQVKTSDSETVMDIDKVDILSGSNIKQDNQQIPPVYENLAPSFPTSTGNFDFSTDPRFLNNMGYSESMDFGPYGFGPNMGQQFSMMESTQQSKAANPFTQRMGQTEQPKLSPLSVIQEKMRSMKQGKFGAFKKYMSSTMR